MDKQCFDLALEINKEAEQKQRGIKIKLWHRQLYSTKPRRRSFPEYLLV